MNKSRKPFLLKLHEVFTFRHFARKSYALFSVLGREVRVGVLSVATLGTAAPCLAQASAPQAGGSAPSPEDSDTLSLAAAWVTAPPAASRMADAASVQVQVLTQADLRAAGVASVNDALKLATGIDVRQRGAFGIQTDISIDGGTFDQVAYYVNGFPVGNPQTGHNAADFPVNVSDIRRIEVMNGAAASAFGTQAFSGAVNIITEAPAHISQTNPLSCYGEVAGGSYGTLLAETRAELIPRGMKSVAGTSLSLSYRRSDGAVANSDFQGGKAFWQAHLRGHNFKLSAQAGATLNDFGANTFYSAAYPNQWEATRRYHVGLRAETEGSVRIVPEFSWVRNTDHFQLIRGTHTAENFHRGDVLTCGFRTYAAWQALQGALRATSAFGAELRQEEIYSSNLGRPMDAAQQFSHYTHHDNRTNVALSLAQTLRWHQLAVSLSVLAQRNTAASRHLRLYPSADVSYALPHGWKLYASWHKTLRLPTFTDLYYKSPTQEGNLGLKPEENSAWRLGAEYCAGTWRAQLRGFYNCGTGMIDWVMRSPDDIYHATSFRLDNMGASLSAALDLRGIFGKRQPLRSLSASYTYIHQERRDGQTPYKSCYALEYLRHKLILRLDHAVATNLTASWSLRLQNRRGTYIPRQEPNSPVPYGTHAILDLRLRWQKPHYEAYIEAQNLTATHYFDLANVPQPRFLVIAGLSLRI